MNNIDIPLKEHVGVKRKNGFYRQSRFTPENPKEFVSKTKEIFDLNCQPQL
jgi:hypothetical protein